MSKLLLVVAAAFLLVGASVATASPHFVKERLAQVPSGWSKQLRASSETQLDLVILVAQQNVDELRETLLQVSDPDHTRYGQHLTNDEVHALVAPREEHVAQVMQWLTSHGVRTNNKTLTFTPNRDMIKVRTTVGKAEQLLKTEYHQYRHTMQNVELVRAQSYSLPSHLEGIIDLVGPTTRFPSISVMTGLRNSEQPRPKKNKHKLRGGKANAADCTTSTPDCLKGLYGVGDYVASPNTNSSIAVSGFINQFIQPSDLATFMAEYDPAHARNATIVGPNDPKSPGMEASLDIQFSMAMSPGVEATFWYFASTTNDAFLEFFLQIATTPNAPWVISTSYGQDEILIDTIGPDYANRLSNEFMKAGLRGISVLFSSGDGGVAGGHPQQCTTFIPTFPGGSPYLTSVGGTTTILPNTPEIGVDFSTGGFSNLFAGKDATYSVAAVKAYLTKFAGSTLPPLALFNQTGRGFPDVSAMATNYPVYNGGYPSTQDGTSASAPTFAGIVALLNDIRFAAGKSSLGFLNPLFYKNPGMFNDITAGDNPGCGTSGFTAVQGWDPVTGLGTPNFQKMAAVIKALP